ncbi:SET domain-containing protein [Hymenopellis radicata]|nr:SET domain-containing protein [Hymenopellis radicata]
MDFATAVALYTHAAQMDDKDPVHVLNRSFANLRLERYTDAITDTTLAIALNVKDDVVLKRKALYRRCLAFIAQGQEKEAFADIAQYENAGADQKTILILKDAITKPQPQPTKAGGAHNRRSSLGTPVSTSYELRDSPGRGKGAFATKVLRRGDMILAEKPLVTLLSYNDDHSDENWQGSMSDSEVWRSIQTITPKNLVPYLSLDNSHSERGPLMGIWFTNAFAAGGVCEVACRFNHSCLPNARYSWHEKSGRLRIMVLAEIKPGEEIFVSYLMGRHGYGSTRAERQARLSLRFRCACSLCNADEDTVKRSDARREELAFLYNTITASTDPNPQSTLRKFVRAMKLLKEEQFHADADDFATDAAAFCSMFSDWEATRDWARIAYEARRDEFGEDSKHTIKAKAVLMNPVRNPAHLQAGLMPKKKLGRFTNL